MAAIPFSSLLRKTDRGDEYYILPGSAYESPDYLQAKQKYDPLLKEAATKYTLPTVQTAIKYLGQQGSASTPLNPYGYMDYTENKAGVWTEHKDAPVLRSYAEQLKKLDPIEALIRQSVATGKTEYDRLQQLTPWGYTAPKPAVPAPNDDSNLTYKEILNKIETQPEVTERQDYTFDMMRADYEKENPGGNFDAYIEDELAKLSGADYDAALAYMGRTPDKKQPSIEDNFSSSLSNFEEKLLDQSKKEVETIKQKSAQPKPEDVYSTFSKNIENEFLKQKAKSNEVGATYGEGFPKIPTWIKQIEQEYNKTKDKPYSPGAPKPGRGMGDVWEGPVKGASAPVPETVYSAFSGNIEKAIAASRAAEKYRRNQTAEGQA